MQLVDEHFPGKKRDHSYSVVGVKLDRMKKHLEQRKMAAVIERVLLTTQPELAHLIGVERHG